MSHQLPARPVGRLLTAFYNYAETAQKRLTGLEGNDANLSGRLAAVEERVLRLENRVMGGPGLG